MSKYTPCKGCPDERWAEVPAWEDAYRVSTCGRVSSLDRAVTYSNGAVRVHKARILRPWLNSGIYPAVRFSRNGKTVTRTVHSLVLEAFAGKRPDGHEARHLDSVPTNAHFSNLRWGTRSENVLDEVEAGTHNNSRKTHCPRGHALVEPNIVDSYRVRGYRSCLACSNARSEVYSARAKGLDISSKLRAISDREFAKIMT